MKYIITIIAAFIILSVNAQEKKKVYLFNMKQEIDVGLERQTKKAFKEAIDMKADLVVIHMNTYGGRVDAADSIRNTILNCPIPVYVFIDNNATSAGALIAISCDSIYMSTGGSIGAATVVDQSGAPVPDKYQSFMRTKMRATAESHGKITVVENGDTIQKWRRDPMLAMAMVDKDIYIEGVSDTGKVLSLSLDEAIFYGYCEGKAETIEEVIAKSGFVNHEIIEYKVSAVDKVYGFLTNPILQGILIMVIMAGIYFELQTPGVGFPLVAAIIACLLYFAPLYIEGAAANWEILLFIVGIGLIILEIFAIPGFGVAGVSGIILAVTGLTLSMVDNVGFDFGTGAANSISRAFLIVSVSMFISLVASIYLGSKLITSPALNHLVLNKTQDRDKGYIGIDNTIKEMIGKEGVCSTMLRPSGKVIINDEIYDAKSEVGYIEKGEKVKVLRFESGQIYVVKVGDSA
ncbi:MAG: nodulation protein NfeD [Bacteroidales bacterium]|nr:nodulation protein NfeD [Bacteroidales bacterium]